MKVNNPLKVDLNRCKKGDILITRHGKKCTYNYKDDSINPFPHRIIYPNSKSHGSRTDDGYVWGNEIQRNERDEDIVQIIFKSR